MSVAQVSRLAALSRLNILGSSPEERFDRVTRIAQELFDVPIAVINLIGEESQFTKSPQKPGQTLWTPLSDSFCNVTIQRPEIMVVPDASKDPRFADFDTVRNDPHVRFYAGRPLSVDEGIRVGTLCVVDTVPRDLTEEEIELLDELGLWVERELRDSAPADRAVATQQALLPTPLRHGDGFSFAGFSRPYGDVAGDYFDWRPDGAGVDITLADVMGKGSAAAIVASAIRSAFQARPGVATAEAVSGVHAQMFGDFCATGAFATLFHARVDTTTGGITYADAGHGLTLIVHADGTHERLSSLDLPLGISEDASWSVHESVMSRGDVLFSCSDGALDLFDGTLDALQQLAEVVRAHPDDEELFFALAALIVMSSPEDDVTVMVIRRA